VEGRGLPDINERLNQDRSCSYERVCMNSNLELLYFSNPKLPPEPIQISDSIYIDFPLKWTNVRNYLPDFPSQAWIAPKVIRSSVLDYSINNNLNIHWTDNSTLHLLYNQFWPENFGHVL